MRLSTGCEVDFLNMIYDINCFFGHWPFRYLRHESLDELIKTHVRAGVTGGALGCLDSIFYSDPSEGDDIMYRTAAGSQYVPTPCINPHLPCIIADIERYSPKAVRVFPTFHGFKLCDALFEPIADYLEKHGIRLLVNTRLYVTREAHFFIPPNPDTDDEAEFVKKHPTLRTAFLGHERSELMSSRLSDVLKNSGSAVCDTSFVRGMTYEELFESAGVDSIVFGSSHPLLCLESTRLTLEHAPLSESEKQAVFGGNYLRFMG